MSLEIKVFPKGPLGENTYLIKDTNTSSCAVVDPGYFGNDIEAAIGDKSNLKLVLLTHGHFDHFNSAADYVRYYPDAQFVAPEKDKWLMYKDSNAEFQSMGMKITPCPEADIFVVEGDEVKFGDYTFTFIETPGHTSGSMCIVCDDILFSGDTLFRLSVGNTSFETGDWPTLVDSIKEKLYALDENMKVYPGHGGETSIGYEMRFNPFV